MKSSKFYAIIISLIVSIGGLLLGISVNISGASLFYTMYFDLTVGSFWEGFAVGASMLGTFVGNFFAGTVSDKLGRKKALLLAAILFSFLTIGSGLATEYSVFLITRFIGGLGIGISLLVVPLYISEFAPSKQRGFLVSFNQLNINIGFLLAFVSNFVVDGMIDDPEMKWRFMLGVGVIFPIIYFILMLFVPESPRWLMQKGREEEAKQVMLKAGGKEHAETEMKQIKKTILEDAESNGGKVLSYANQWSILLSKNMSRVLIVAFSIALFQMLSGINAVIFFAPKILSLAGLGGDSFLQANLIGITMVVMTFISMFIIDKAGRKPLLYIGIGLIVISLFAAGYSFKNAQYSLDKQGIELINTKLVDYAIKEKAKSIDANMYMVDRIETADGYTKLYIKDDLVQTFSINEPEIARAIKEASILSEILNNIEGKVFTDEIYFFHSIKNEILSEVKAKIKKAQTAKLNKTEAFAFEINKGLANNVKPIKLAEEIATLKYSMYKSKILDASISINSFIVLLGILGFVIGFSISLGPITWILLSEVFPSKIRGLGISIAGMTNGITSFVVATVFPLELEMLGSGTTYFIYAGFMVVFLVIVFKWFPETKGKSLEEIEEEMVK